MTAPERPALPLTAELIEQATVAALRADRDALAGTVRDCRAALGMQMASGDESLLARVIGLAATTAFLRIRCECGHTKGEHADVASPCLGDDCTCSRFYEDYDAARTPQTPSEADATKPTRMSCSQCGAHFPLHRCSGCGATFPHAPGEVATTPATSAPSAAEAWDAWRRQTRCA